MTFFFLTECVRVEKEMKHDPQRGKGKHVNQDKEARYLKEGSPKRLWGGTFIEF